jgi:hypothetical protein
MAQKAAGPRDSHDILPSDGSPQAPGSPAPGCTSGNGSSCGGRKPDEARRVPWWCATLFRWTDDRDAQAARKQHSSRLLSASSTAPSAAPLKNYCAKIPAVLPSVEGI